MAEERSRLSLEIVWQGVERAGAPLANLSRQAASANQSLSRLQAAGGSSLSQLAQEAGAVPEAMSKMEGAASQGVSKIAEGSKEAAAAWARVAAGWREVASGDYLRRAQEMAAVGKEQEKLAQKQRELNIIAREGSFVGGLKVMQERLATVGRVGAIGFGLITAGVGGWVRAGFQGTAEAQRLSHAMSILSRAIADVFAPWIQRAVEWVSQLAARFQSLTGAQQESARRWIALGLGVTGFMALLPRLLGGLAAVTKAFQMLGLAKAAALAGPIGIAALAVGGALASTTEGRDALANLAKSVEPLLVAFGKLAGTLAEALGPALQEFSKWLAIAVDALAKYVGKLSEPEGAVSATAGGTFLARLFGLSDDLKKAGEIQEAAKAKTGLTAAGSGFEKPEDLWRRLQTRVAQSGLGTPEERTAKASEASLEELKKIANKTGQTDPGKAAEAGRGQAAAGS